MPVINTFIINTQIINGPQIQGIPVGGGTFVSVEQQVALIGGGTLVSFDQTVELLISGGGTFISIDQITNTVGGGTLVNIEQRILDPAVPTRVDGSGWDATLVVGSRVIPASEISGDITVVRTENDSALLDVTMRPATGIQDITAFQGKSVTLDIQESGGTTRVYTGVVDIPEVDLIAETITLRCTNRRDELINSEFSGKEFTVGFYSTSVFSEPTDTAQEINQRLETIPKALDFDAFNKSHITAWLPKSTPDFTLTDSGIYRDSPKVEVASRGRIVNQVNITFEYRYDRNYHQQRLFSWESPIFDTPCFLLADGYSRASRAQIQVAVFGAGWPLKNDITFSSSLDDGWYQCGTTNVGNRRLIAFTNTNTEFATSFKVDEEGNPISDSDGNQQYTSTRTSVTDFTNTFAEKATWFGTTRWAQTISETYTIAVKAPQSITQYGTIDREEAHGVLSDFDSSQWEDYDAYDNQGTSSYHIDRDNNISEFNNAWNTVINRAKTSILGTHRDNKVIFSRSLWTAIDLKHTVELSSGPIDAKGKVFKIEHRLSVSSGEAVTTVEIVLSRAQGSQSGDTITLPTRPTDTPTMESSTIFLGNHFGEDPSTTKAQNWTGMIGNKFTQGNRTTFPESFVVDAPEVPAELRDLRTLTTTDTFNIEVPNDTLVITFDGKA